MDNNHSPLARSFSILHTILSLVLALYIIDILYAKLVYLNFGWFSTLIILPVKIFCLSGILGHLIEIAGDERFLLSLESFKTNARKYWKTLTAVICVFAGIYGTLKFISPLFGQIPAFMFFQYFKFVIIYIMAERLIFDKYIKAMKLPRRKIIMSMKSIDSICVLYIMEMIIFHLPLFINTGNFELPRLTSFAVLYIQFLEFLFISTLILDQYPEIKAKFRHDKELYLINPVHGGILESIFYSFALKSYPPVFVVLKALTPGNYRVRIFNRAPFKERYYQAGKLVAITCYTSNCYEAYEIARKFRKAGSRVVLGGPHVTYFPEEALEYGDSVVIGEAEGVWRKVIEDFEAGCLKPRYSGMADEENHSDVHQELLASAPAVIKDFLETSRGCKFKCHFCTIPSLSGGRLRRKPVKEIVELINKVKHKYKYVTFIDNNIYSDPGYAKQLFQALKPLGIKWGTQCTIDIAKNEETLKLARESGFSTVLFGYEISGNSAENKQGGKFAMAQRYKQYTRKIKDLGIMIKAHFIIGFDSDTLKDMGRMWKDCFSLYPFVTSFSLLTPLPGSRLYNDSVNDNKLTNLNWRQYTCQYLVFRHPGINNTLFASIYPFFMMICFFTTSTCGLVVICFCLAFFLHQSVF